jgi:hypothetical protein
VPFASGTGGEWPFRLKRGVAVVGPARTVHAAQELFIVALALGTADDRLWVVGFVSAKLPKLRKKVSLHPAKKSQR